MRLNLKCYLPVVLVTGTVFTWLQWGANLPDPDSFYHARMLTLIQEHGLLFQFPWLQYSFLAQQFTDQHLLYHLIHLPLLSWVDSITALKIGAVISAMGLSVLLVYLLRSFKLKYSSLALIPLYCVTPFLIRINLLKATFLALLCMIGILALLFKRRFRWAWLLTVIYTWTHGGFILAVVIGGCFFIGDTIARSIRNQRICLGDPRPVWATVFGSIAGLIVNPYFPNNLWFYWQQLVQIGLVNYQGVLQVGMEWYPFAPSDLVAFISTILIGVVIALVVTVRHYRYYLTDSTALSLFFIALFFLMATLRSRRYIEYSVPTLWLWICYILAAQPLSWLSRKIQWRSLGHRILFGYVTIALLFAWGRSVQTTYQYLRSQYTLTFYQSASEYLREQTQPGNVVFHTSWDDFPILFYHNTKDYYIAGLDPTFMYLYNSKLYQQWQDISTGKIKTNLAKLIQEQFRANYVFIDRDNNNSKLFDAYLQRDPFTQLEFAGDRTRVYRLLPAS